ncbi:hypothetical protein KEM48_014634 [Puccinia striiformis f. sp. tritici PST-130]|nr:hypothetical protein KEM48_014634 [Puccinia striiformis f. sp. tritici PST-130]
MSNLPFSRTGQDYYRNDCRRKAVSIACDRASVGGREDREADAFAVPSVLSVRDQASICPFALREVSVLAELALGHLRYFLTDVPPQSNSPPGGVLGIRIAPGPGRGTPRTRTAAFDGRPHAHGRGPRFDARSPRLVLNATEYQPRPGTNGHGRRHGDRAARRSHAGRTDGEPTTRRDDGRRPDAPAAGTARSALPSKWGNDASSGISGRRGDGRPKPPAWTPTPTYATLGMSPNNARLESSSTDDEAFGYLKES